MKDRPPNFAPEALGVLSPSVMFASCTGSELRFGPSDRKSAAAGDDRNRSGEESLARG